MSFANYAAGAIMMPYGRFLRAAEEHRYAIDRLCGQFGANVEQIAHRMTTLGRSGARAFPFFMLRVDPAGNISKRYAGENFPFSHFGGTCPRWHLHAAFQTPGQTIRQLIETPDGQRFFTDQPDNRAPDSRRNCGTTRCSRSGWAATFATRRASPTPTASTSPTRRRPQLVRPARSAPAWSAPTARCRLQAENWRCTRTARRFRPSRSCPARARRVRARASRGPNSRGRQPRRRSIGGSW